MFDVNNKDIIVKLIMTKDDDIVIPLYVKIYNMRYSILELNDITDFDASSFKVGFGTSTSFLLKNSFPDKNIFDFDNISTFIEFDEKLKFTNVKNNLGLNKTINEDDIFADLQMKIIEKIPPDNFIEQVSFFDGGISCKFNSDVYSTGDLSKKMRLFKNGIEILSKTFNQLDISGNIVSFRGAIGDLEPADYVVKIDNGMFKNSFGNIFEGITNNTDWNFTLVEEITPTISISWEDGTDTDLRGTQNDITLKIKAETYSVSNPIIGYSWESSTDGISYTQFAINNSNKTVYLVPNNNFYRVKATLQDNSVIYSNVV
jgi:hypothetical protein